MLCVGSPVQHALRASIRAATFSMIDHRLLHPLEQIVRINALGRNGWVLRSRKSYWKPRTADRPPTRADAAHRREKKGKAQQDPTNESEAVW
jgi:hypothetical protein